MVGERQIERFLKLNTPDQQQLELPKLAMMTIQSCPSNHFQFVDYHVNDIFGELSNNVPGYCSGK